MNARLAVLEAMHGEPTSIDLTYCQRKLLIPRPAGLVGHWRYQLVTLASGVFDDALNLIWGLPTLRTRRCRGGAAMRMGSGALEHPKQVLHAGFRFASTMAILLVVMLVIISKGAFGYLQQGRRGRGEDSATLKSLQVIYSTFCRECVVHATSNVKNNWTARSSPVDLCLTESRIDSC